MKKQWAAVLVLSALAVGAVRAADTDAGSPEERLALAREVISVSMEGTAEEMVAETLRRTLLKDPRFAGYEDVVLAWVGGMHAGEVFAEESARVCAERFTAQELRGLKAFYQSPLGRKYIKEWPALEEQLTGFGRDWAAKNYPVLIEMIRKRQEDLAREAQKLMPQQDRTFPGKTRSATPDGI